jgi:hypothetical protein
MAYRFIWFITLLSFPTSWATAWFLVIGRGVEKGRGWMRVGWRLKGSEKLSCTAKQGHEIQSSTRSQSGYRYSHTHCLSMQGLLPRCLSMRCLFITEVPHCLPRPGLIPLPFQARVWYLSLSSQGLTPRYFSKKGLMHTALPSSGWYAMPLHVRGDFALHFYAKANGLCLSIPVLIPHYLSKQRLRPHCFSMQGLIKMWTDAFHAGDALHKKKSRKPWYCMAKLEWIPTDIAMWAAVHHQI